MTQRRSKGPALPRAPALWTSGRGGDSLVGKRGPSPGRVRARRRTSSARSSSALARGNLSSPTFSRTHSAARGSASVECTTFAWRGAPLVLTRQLTCTMPSLPGAQASNSCSRPRRLNTICAGSSSGRAARRARRSGAEAVGASGPLRISGSAAPHATSSGRSTPKWARSERTRSGTAESTSPGSSASPPRTEPVASGSSAIGPPFVRFLVSFP